MAKKNCWEVKKCGREPGGAKVKEFGICPAAEEYRVDGTNEGMNGGRACWAVAGTFCGGAVQGEFASKLDNCMNCEFYECVVAEQWPRYTGSAQILSKLGR